MRRNLAVLAMAGALAGCSFGGTTPTPAVHPAPTPADPSAAASALAAASAAASSADQALAGNTRAICDQATRTSAGFGETFIDDLRLRIDAAAQGGDARKQAEQKIARDVQNYSVALADMAALTTDATLKTALNQMSAQVTAFKGDLTKIDADKMAELSATLDKACGKS
jgi:hypothetical protein